MLLFLLYNHTNLASATTHCLWSSIAQLCSRVCDWQSAEGGTTVADDNHVSSELKVQIVNTNVHQVESGQYS